jgi:predicted  nucleic acid-binding Zn-ribbon protein
MLLCKACNTRFEDGRSACPSCGRRVFASLKEAPKTSDAEPRPLATLDEQTRPEREIDLGEVDLLAEAVEPEAAAELKREVPAVPREAPAVPREAPAVPREAPAVPREVPVAPRVVAPRGRGRRLEPEPGPAVFHLTAAQVRTLVAEQPSLLEPDLAIYRDARSGVIGVDLRTPVGAIDLLARAGDGAFVIVAVPDLRDVETLMPEMLARIGYVRKHFATDQRTPVRGIVVIEEIPEELAYAAAGVSQTISFRAYRVALTFHPLPL